MGRHLWLNENLQRLSPADMLDMQGLYLEGGAYESLQPSKFLLCRSLDLARHTCFHPLFSKKARVMDSL
jgi:hypothetical protein